MFDNYYEIEKMMQLRVEEALREAKKERLVAVVKNRRSRRGLLALLIILKEKLK